MVQPVNIVVKQPTGKVRPILFYRWPFTSIVKCEYEIIVKEYQPWSSEQTDKPIRIYSIWKIMEPHDMNIFSELFSKTQFNTESNNV